MLPLLQVVRDSDGVLHERVVVGLDRVLGKDALGKDDGHDDDDEGKRQLADYYQGIVQSRAPIRCLGSFVEGFTFATAFESVDCPLVDDAGEVTHIIGAIDKASSACG